MPRFRLAASLAAIGLALLVAAAVVWVRSPAATFDGRTSVQTGTATPSYERGKALFIAKGCVRCHWHDQLGASRASFSRGSSGPNLSEIDTPYTLLHNDPEYLREWLRDPWVKNPNRVMPDMDLSEEEIESLLAFLVPSRWTPNP